MTGYFRSHRLLTFLLIHVIICAIVCAVFFLQRGPLPQPPLAPLAIAFAQTFLGSFAGAFLSIVELVIGAFKGFAGLGEMVVHGKSLPIPILSGAAAVLAFLLIGPAVNSFIMRTSFIVFILCSCLLLFSSLAYFGDSANEGKAMAGHPVIYQLVR